MSLEKTEQYKLKFRSYGYVFRGISTTIALI
jgi:hypothetical protein